MGSCLDKPTIGWDTWAQTSIPTFPTTGLLEQLTANQSPDVRMSLDKICLDVLPSATDSRKMNEPY